MQGQKVIEQAHIGIILPHCASLQSKIAGVENALHTLFLSSLPKQNHIMSICIQED